MAAATLTLLVLTLTGQTAALHSDKAFVTSEDSAQIELSALDESGRPLPDAQVSLTVNVGAVTEPLLTQDGTFSATYRPPKQEGAQVALFHATAKSGAFSSRAWLALPIHGAHLLRVQAPPRSRVRVSIGAASFGPVTVAASGEAAVPVKVPPGISSAQVTTVERSGRTRTQTVPLPAPRFVRIRLVPLEAPVQDKPARLQGFVVDESGNPAVAIPPLSVSVDRGTLGPIEAKESGTFEIPYTAPAPSGSPVKISAAPTDETDRSFTLPIDPLPAPPTSPGEPGATDGRPPVAATEPLPPSLPWIPWQPSVGVLMFLQSNAAASNGLGIRAEASLRLAQLPLEALVQLDLRKNGEVNEMSPVEGLPPLTKTFTLSGLSLRAGARWSRPILTRGMLFADMSLGFLGMSGTVSLRSGESSLEQDIRSRGPAFAVGGGFGWEMGPGRLYGQLQWGYAPGRDQVQGNLAGVSVAAGYQLVFGGDRQP
ncbi:hypothetical protein [Hyalangium sp.]|uniref:hypothetical protein n=1 Tax=Hyalangium sp. TaxID=2028555 RepID=UPI002D5AF185|nr:hypothetical protein [Hyalangium sp.]HYH98150.1 hypothetical protein [Hyalangium sp.]